MTPSLRKAHRRIWLSLAILLPAVFIAAVASIPETQVAPSSTQPGTEVLPIVLVTGGSDQFSVKISSDDTQTEQRMEVLIKKALRVPECLVYLKCAEREKMLIGKLGSKGTHHFDLGNTIISKPCQVEFFNPFDKAAIANITLK